MVHPKAATKVPVREVHLAVWREIVKVLMLASLYFDK